VRRRATLKPRRPSDPEPALRRGCPRYGASYDSTTLEAKVHDFLAQKRIAVVGVSRNDGDHPTGNLIYRRLKKSGHDVFPVNPHMQTFDGGYAVIPTCNRSRAESTAP
jgi:hypothetical protein